MQKVYAYDLLNLIANIADVSNFQEQKICDSLETYCRAENLI